MLGARFKIGRDGVISGNILGYEELMVECEPAETKLRR